LHKMNPVRMQFIRDKLTETLRDEDKAAPSHGRILEGLDVLDVGCGGGLLSEVCLKSKQYTQVDVRSIESYEVRWSDYGH
jgi:2-polyprenyl-3-methyl-5-hydroxy-6-metoxy-1,4-benzoquinol methylase